MEWRKHRAKQQIEWAREDIAWSTDMEKSWRKLLLKHMKRKHEGKYTAECEICKLWKEIIENEKANRIASKRQIQEVLRGER